MNLIFSRPPTKFERRFEYVAYSEEAVKAQEELLFEKSRALSGQEARLDARARMERGRLASPRDRGPQTPVMDPDIQRLGGRVSRFAMAEPGEQGDASSILATDFSLVGDEVPPAPARAPVEAPVPTPTAVLVRSDTVRLQLQERDGEIATLRQQLAAANA